MRLILLLRETRTQLLLQGRTAPQDDEVHTVPWKTPLAGGASGLPVPHSFSLFLSLSLRFLFFFFLDFIYLFMKEREAETQAEGEAGSMQG